MIGPEWNQEKSAIFLRWILIVSVFFGMFFFMADKTESATLNATNLVYLGIVALVGNLIFHLLFGRIKINQYHNLCWFFDLVVVFFLIRFTGGVINDTGSGLSLNLFVFLLPFIVLNNAIGKPWYSGFGSALLVNGVLVYFLVTSKGAAEHWSIVAIPAFFNFAVGSLHMFSEQWIVVGDTMEVKQREREVEKAYETLRKESEARRKREEELYDKTRKLTSVIQVSRALGSSFSLHELFETIVEKARDEMNSQMAFIMLEEKSMLNVVHSVGVSNLTKEVFRCRVEPGQNIIAEVMLKAQAIRIDRESNSKPFQDFAGAVERIKTLLVVPLKAPKDDQPLGILGVSNLLVGDKYSKDHEDFLSILAIEAAMFIRQLKLKEELERSYFELITSLAQAIEAKDPYTHGHVQRVADYSIRLAHALKVPPKEIQRIEKAAILHDIGKIATPESVLNKPGRLTDEEFAIMKNHVVESRKLLTGITSGIDDKIKDYVGYHHERWDGKGYPKGLRSEEIPLGAQIIAVADTFDAMTSDRPYRKGFETEEALKRLIDSAGTQFNPNILHTFFNMLGFDKETGKIKMTETRELNMDHEPVSKYIKTQELKLKG